jgi:hypothetical protein
MVAPTLGEEFSRRFMRPSTISTTALFGLCLAPFLACKGEKTAMIVVQVSPPTGAAPSDAVRFTIEKDGQPTLVRTHPGALSPAGSKFGLPGIADSYQGAVGFTVELLSGTCTVAATDKVNIQLVAGASTDAGMLQPTPRQGCGATPDAGVEPDGSTGEDALALDAGVDQAPDAGAYDAAAEAGPPPSAWRPLVTSYMSPDKPSSPRLAPISGTRTLLAWRTGDMGEGVSVADLPDQINKTFRPKTSAVPGKGLGFTHDGAQPIVHPFVAWAEDTKVVVKRGDATDASLTAIVWNQVGEPFGATGATSPALCPTVTFDSTGVPVVAWSQGSPVAAVQLRRLSTTGGWDFVTPIEGAAGNNKADCPLLAARGKTVLAAAWVGSAPDDTRKVYVQRWMDMNRWEPFGMPQSSGNADAVTLGGLVLDAMEAPIVAWQELRGTTSTIFVRRWDDTKKAWSDLGGQMSLAVPAANAPPALALDRNSPGATPLLAWFDNSAGRPSVAVWKLAGDKWERVGSLLRGSSIDSNPAELALAYGGGIPYVTFADVAATTRSLYVYSFR